MAEVEARVMSGAMASGGKVAARTRRGFYVAMSIVLIGMIFVGFWPSYYGPLTRGTTNTPWILHIHGVVFIAWMFLLVLQTVLAARGKLPQHRRVGNFGIALGSAVFVMGLVVSFVAPAWSWRPCGFPSARATSGSASPDRSSRHWRSHGPERGTPPRRQ